jgi:hypothetical protein
MAIYSSAFTCWSEYDVDVILKVKVKVKVKLSLCFNLAPRQEGLLGEWRYSAMYSWPRH